MEAPRQRFQGIQKESAGYRLLKSMGWEEGEGLGASKQGIKEHIRVKKNFENWGVGAISAADRARDWSTGMADFHRVLSNLSEITSSHAGGEEKEGSEKEGSSEQSLVRKKRKRDKAGDSISKTTKKTKNGIKTTLKISKELKLDDETVNASEDLERDEPTSKGHGHKQKTATHIGRFKKRESAKVVKNYSAHDLAAILGVHETAAFPSFPGQTQAKGSEGSKEIPGSEALEQSDVEAMPGTDKDQTVCHLPTEGNGMEVMVGKVFDMDGGEKQWWSDYFVCTGQLGSLSKSEKRKNIGFSEQDQADLYNETNKGATQGRVGLGRSSMPKKVAGVCWQGKKVKLDVDDSDEEVKGGETKEEHVERRDGLLKLKWRKVLKKMLRGQPQGITLTELQQVVMERYSVSKALATDLEAIVLKKIQSSSKYSLDGKLIKVVPKIPV